MSINLNFKMADALSRLHGKALNLNNSFDKNISYISKEIAENQNRPNSIRQIDLNATKIDLSASWLSYCLDMDRLIGKMGKLVVKIDNEEQYDPQAEFILRCAKQFTKALQRTLVSKSREVDTLDRQIGSFS